MITNENLLDLIESMGRCLKQRAGHVARYEKYVTACRNAWEAIKAGKRPWLILGHLNGQLQGSGTGAGLIIGAMNGRFEGRPDGWVTFEGDLYYVNLGDKLNLPQVERLANRDMPPERRKLDGARKIAATLPNPCTRVQGSVRVC